MAVEGHGQQATDKINIASATQKIKFQRSDVFLGNSMILDEEMAEVIGAFIGDGCLSKWNADGREKRAVVFTGSWKNDTAYYNDVIVPSIKGWTKSSITPYHRKKENTILVRIFDKGMIDFLLQLGFNFGKKAGTVVVPDAILYNPSLAKACVRGIFNTDGTVYRRYSRLYVKHGMISSSMLNYAVVQIKMKSKYLIQQVYDILQSLGYRPNKIASDNNGSWLVRLNRQEEIARFFSEIATTHSYHIQRYNNIKHGSPNQTGS